MKFKDLLFEQRDAVAIITLNRPKESNSFSIPMLESLEAALRVVKNTKQIRAVILTGAGKAFCAGGDVKEMARGKVKGLAMKSFLRDYVHRIPLFLQEFDKPIIAAVNGPAAGAGLDLALMCDLRIVSKKAVLLASFVRVGLAPGDGGAFFLPRLVGLGKALEYLLTGKPIDLDEALRLGLINALVEPDKVLPEAEAWAEQLASLPPLAVQATKRAAYQGLKTQLPDHLEDISSKLALLSQTKDHRKAIKAALSRRKLTFKGE